MFSKIRCFGSFGGVASRVHEDQDPFVELDSAHPTAGLDDLISQVPMANEARCFATEYINGEDLPTCSEEMWEEECFASIIQTNILWMKKSPMMHNLTLNHLLLR